MIRFAVLLACVLASAVLKAANVDDLLAEEVPVARAVAARSNVFEISSSRALAIGGRPNPVVVREMVDSVVKAVTGKPTVAAAWRSLVNPDDTVGIKVAAAPGGQGGTHPAVVRAISRGLQSAGVPASKIVVWDRNRDDLLEAGYTETDPDYQLRWIEPAVGYDREAMITAPILGRLIWGDSKFGEKEGTRLVDILSTGTQLSSTSFFSELLSKRVTKVINVPSLCDSVMTGLNGAIANITLWNVDNWRRFTKEPNFGDPFLAEIYADPIVSDKVVLTIVDALMIQFAGGPFPAPNFVREYDTIFASRDPVALDSVAIRLIDEYRKVSKLPPILETASHVKSASEMGLGNAETERIDMVTVTLPTQE